MGYDDSSEVLTYAEAAANRAAYAQVSEEEFVTCPSGFLGDAATVLTGFGVKDYDSSESGGSFTGHEGVVRGVDDSGDENWDSVSARGRRTGVAGGFDARHLRNLRDAAEREVYASALRGVTAFKSGAPNVKYWREIPETPQLVFSVEETAEVYDTAARVAFCASFSAGRRYVRLVMPTSAGKTTSLPMEISSASRARVLMLVPSYALVRYAVKGLGRYGVASTRRLSEGVIGVCVMSYDDFSWAMAAGGYKTLKGSYNVIYIDESHDTSQGGSVIRAQIATYLTGESVVLATATAHGAASMKQFRPVQLDESVRPMTMDEAVSGGLFSGEWCRDRTMVFLPDDYEVYRMRDIITQLGYIPLVLDSASTSVDVENVRAALFEARGTPRFLLAPSKFGQSYDFPISHVIDCGFEYVYVQRGDAIERRKLYRTAAAREQIGGRAGRHFSGRATVTFLSDVVSPHVDVRDDARMGVWLMLKLSAIRPLDSVWDSTVLFPRGITQKRAYNMCCSTLPPFVVNAYMTEEGYVAREYAEAMSFFCYRGHPFIAAQGSVVAEPLWRTEVIGDYQGEGSVGATTKVKVPFTTVGPFRVLLHAIYAHRAALFRMKPLRQLPDADKDESGDEARPRRVAPRQLRFDGKRVSGSVFVDRGKALPVPPAEVEASRAVGSKGSPGRRRLSTEAVPEVTDTARAVFPSGGVGDDSPVDAKVLAWAEGIAASVTTDGSAGHHLTVERLYTGSKVKIYKRIGSSEFVYVAAGAFSMLEAGQTLDAGAYGILLDMLNGDVKYLVRCVLFDDWSSAWIAVLRTMHDGVMALLTLAQRRGSLTLLERLWRRHAREFGLSMAGSATVVRRRDAFWGVSASVVVAPRSSVSRKNVASTVGGPGDAKLRSVAQSDAVKVRIREIRMLFPLALSAHEAGGVMRPTLRTSMLVGV